MFGLRTLNRLTCSVCTTSPTVGGKRTLSTTCTRPPPDWVEMSLFSMLAPFIVMICPPITNSFCCCLGKTEVCSPWHLSSLCPQTGIRWTSAWSRQRWAPPGRQPGRPTWRGRAPGGSSRSGRARWGSSSACLLPEVNHYNHGKVATINWHIWSFGAAMELRLINQCLWYRHKYWQGLTSN